MALPQIKPELPSVIITKEMLTRAVEKMLVEVASASTLNDEILNAYADRIAEMAVQHVRQGKPSEI